MAITTAQVQELYVAYLGRAADKSGLDYWMAELNAEPAVLTLEDLRANFVNEQAEYTDAYAGLTRTETVSKIYLNLFGRAADEVGLAYWTTGEGASVNVDQLLVAFVNGAAAADAAVVSNKVFVANTYTVTAGADYNATAAAAVIANVDGTAASVTAALVTIANVTFGLTAELAELTVAQAGVTDFVAAWGVENGVEDATATDVTGALTTAEAKLGNYNSADTTAVRTAKIAEEQAALNSALATAKAALTESTADVAAVTGLKTAIDRFVTAFDAAEAAEEADVVAKTAVNDTLAVADVYADIIDISGATSSNVYIAIDGTTNKASVNVTAAALITDGLSAAQAASYLTALSAYATAINAELVTTKAATDTLALANTRLDTIEGLSPGIYVTDGDVTLATGAVGELAGIASAYATDVVAVADAEDALTDFATLLADIAAAKQDTDALAVLTKAVADQVVALEDQGYAVELPGTATDTVAAVDNVDFGGTSESDIYVISSALNGEIFGTNADAFANVNIDNFGFLGDDAIYALGYTQGADITAGNNSTLEFFMAQNGANVDVTFETSVFGSNAATPEAFVITLTGVALADLSVADGYITIA